MKRKLYLIISVFLLCLMLARPAVTMDGARQGLLLWYQNLLPALFPYMILSSLILGLDVNSRLTGWLDPVSTKLLHISGNGIFAVFTGFLCGYPLGAKITAQMIRTRKISITEGQYLISFCNIASPGFLIQYVTAQSLGSLAFLKPILFCVYGSAVLTALLLQPLYRKQLQKNALETPAFSENRKSLQAVSAENSVQTSGTEEIFTIGSAIMESFEAMTRLGGYLVIFSIITKMVTAHFTTVTTFNVLLIGVTEITNGVHYITSGSSVLSTKLLLLSFCVSFGGLSCYAQSAGMCRYSGLSMPLYLAAKLLNGLLALLLMALFLWYGAV